MKEEMKKKIGKKKIENVIEVPENVNVELNGRILKLSSGEGGVEKALAYNVKLDGKKIILRCEKPTKRDKKLINTTKSHIKNMISGLDRKFVYKLQVASVHFPITVNIQGNELVIKNFLGEKKDRKAKLLEGVKVKIEGDIISVESYDKEKAGQTAANIETATKIKGRDRRVFQDGIYITEKEKGARRVIK